MGPMGGSPASGPGISGNRGQSLPQGISIEISVLLHPGSRTDPFETPEMELPSPKVSPEDKGIL